MNKLFFMLFALLIPKFSFAQIKLPKDTFDKNVGACLISESNPEQKIIRCTFDPMPEFPGGEIALKIFISENMHYPDSALKYEKQGIVRVQFTIEEDGSICDAIVKRPLGYGLDEEAIRVINLMPKWKPTLNGSKPLKIKYTFPIKFLLE